MPADILDQLREERSRQMENGGNQEMIDSLDLVLSKASSSSEAMSVLNSIISSTSKNGRQLSENIYDICRSFKVYDKYASRAIFRTSRLDKEFSDIGESGSESFQKINEELKKSLSLLSLVHRAVRRYSESFEGIEIEDISKNKRRTYVPAKKEKSIFDSLPKFAKGGRVGGNSPSGDNFIARVNSEEEILKKEQAKEIKKQLLEKQLLEKKNQIKLQQSKHSKSTKTLSKEPKETRDALKETREPRIDKETKREIQSTKTLSKEPKETRDALKETREPRIDKETKREIQSTKTLSKEPKETREPRIDKETKRDKNLITKKKYLKSFRFNEDKNENKYIRKEFPYFKDVLESSENKSIQKFAKGGEIKGNSYSGDNITIKANSGEWVLTAKQMSNLGKKMGLRGAKDVFREAGGSPSRKLYDKKGNRKYETGGEIDEGFSNVTEAMNSIKNSDNPSEIKKALRYLDKLKSSSDAQLEYEKKVKDIVMRNDNENSVKLIKELRKSRIEKIANSLDDIKTTIENELTNIQELKTKNDSIDEELKELKKQKNDIEKSGEYKKAIQELNKAEKEGTADQINDKQRILDEIIKNSGLENINKEIEDKQEQKRTNVENLNASKGRIKSLNEQGKSLEKESSEIDERTTESWAKALTEKIKQERFNKSEANSEAEISLKEKIGAVSFISDDSRSTATKSLTYKNKSENSSNEIDKSIYSNLSAGFDQTTSFTEQSQIDLIKPEVIDEMTKIAEEFKTIEEEILNLVKERQQIEEDIKNTEDKINEIEKNYYQDIEDSRKSSKEIIDAGNEEIENVKTNISKLFENIEKNKEKYIKRIKNDKGLTEEKKEKKIERYLKNTYASERRKIERSNEYVNLNKQKNEIEQVVSVTVENQKKHEADISKERVELEQPLKEQKEKLQNKRLENQSKKIEINERVKDLRRKADIVMSGDIKQGGFAAKAYKTGNDIAGKILDSIGISDNSKKKAIGALRAGPEKASKFFGEAASGKMKAIGGALGKAGFGKMGGFIAGTGSKIAGAAGSMIGGLASKAIPVVGWVKAVYDVGKKIVKAIGDAYEKLAKVIRTDIKSGQARRTFDSQLGKGEFSKFENSFGLLRDEMSALGPVIQKAVRDGMDFGQIKELSSNIQKSFGELDQGVLQKVMDAISGMSEQNVETLMHGGSSEDLESLAFAIGEKGNYGEIADLMEQGVFGGEATSEKDADLAEAGITPGDKAIVKEMRIITRMFEDMKQVTQKLMGGPLKAAFASIIEPLKAVWDLLQPAFTIIGAILEQIGQKIQITGKIFKILISPFLGIQKAVNKFYQKFAAMQSGMFQDMIDFLDEMANNISKVMEAVYDIALEPIIVILEHIYSGVKKIMGAVFSLYTGGRNKEDEDKKRIEVNDLRVMEKMSRELKKITSGSYSVKESAKAAMYSGNVSKLNENYGSSASMAASFSSGLKNAMDGLGKDFEELGKSAVHLGKLEGEMRLTGVRDFLEAQRKVTEKHVKAMEDMIKKYSESLKYFQDMKSNLQNLRDYLSGSGDTRKYNEALNNIIQSIVEEKQERSKNITMSFSEAKSDFTQKSGKLIGRLSEQVSGDKKEQVKEYAQKNRELADLKLSALRDPGNIEKQKAVKIAEEKIKNMYMNLASGMSEADKMILQAIQEDANALNGIIKEVVDKEIEAMNAIFNSTFEILASLKPERSGWAKSNYESFEGNVESSFQMAEANLSAGQLSKIANERLKLSHIEEERNKKNIMYNRDKAISINLNAIETSKKEREELQKKLTTTSDPEERAKIEKEISEHKKKELDYSLRNTAIQQEAAKQLKDNYLQERKIREEMINREYEGKKKILELSRESVDIQLDLYSSIGAPMEVIVDLERQRIGMAEQEYELAKDRYEKLKEERASESEIQKAKLDMEKQQANVIKNRLGAQRSMMEKIFGNMIGAFGEVAGIIGPNSEYSKAKKYGMGYSTNKDGMVAKGGKSTGGYRDRMFGVNGQGQDILDETEKGEEGDVDALQGIAGSVTEIEKLLGDYLKMQQELQEKKGKVEKNEKPKIEDMDKKSDEKEEKKDLLVELKDKLCKKINEFMSKFDDFVDGIVGIIDQIGESGILGQSLGTIATISSPIGACLPLIRAYFERKVKKNSSTSSTPGTPTAVSPKENPNAPKVESLSADSTANNGNTSSNRKTDTTANKPAAEQTNQQVKTEPAVSTSTQTAATASNNSQSTQTIHVVGELKLDDNGNLKAFINKTVDLDWSNRGAGKVNEAMNSSSSNIS